MRPENLPENYFAQEDPKDISFPMAKRNVLVRGAPASQRKTSSADSSLQLRADYRRACHGIWFISSSADDVALK